MKCGRTCCGYWNENANMSISSSNKSLNTKTKKFIMEKKIKNNCYHWDCLNFPFNILHKEVHQEVSPNFGNVNNFE